VSLTLLFLLLPVVRRLTLEIPFSINYRARWLVEEADQKSRDRENQVRFCLPVPSRFSSSLYSLTPPLFVPFLF